MKEERKKFAFDVREIDAWNDPECGWIWNSSFHIGTMETAAKDEKRALVNYLKKRGISFKLNRTIIYDDGFVIEIQDRKTKEPLFAAIPNF